MTATIEPGTTGATTARVPTAQDQVTLSPDQVLHSANSGLIIHRVGQFKYEFAKEGHGFSVDLLKYINEKQVGVATTFCYEETFGTRDRVHWLIHMRSLDDYKKLLHMVDHDEEFQDISIVDRLPEKGHGNWEKIFIESSMQERILVPQHGLNQTDHDEEHDDGMFAPPARNRGRRGDLAPTARGPRAGTDHRRRESRRDTTHGEQLGGRRQRAGPPHHVQAASLRRRPGSGSGAADDQTGPRDSPQLTSDILARSCRTALVCI